MVNVTIYSIHGSYGLYNKNGFPDPGLQVMHGSFLVSRLSLRKWWKLVCSGDSDGMIYLTRNGGAG